ncbi:pseudouridine synthase [Henriciella algicola]|uniref:Dual-specificity RNA pseudouridine synthase RluF n=1 Tax=Henriciella algicola TaxID=1608422 RepID=A0A399RDA9_9PROT|nr:rRNA pseudouridine synthase [Henriciella algicola]
MSNTYTYDGTEPVRLNKWMASLGICSRREAETLISQGSVSVEGAKVSEPGHKIEPGQTMTLAGKATKALDDQLTIVLHKPVGYVSAQPEGEQIPAIRLASKDNLLGKAPKIPGRNPNFAPLGRLDMDSRGLLLLSEDGVLAKAVIGPDSALDKEYIVTVQGQITDPIIGKLRHGLSLDGRRLKAAKVDLVSPGRLRFVLREGRNRQIRRMCELVGLVVIDLFRTRIGPLQLDKLPEGKWRALTSEERAALIKASKPLSGASGGSRARKASARSRGKSRSGPARAAPRRKP